MDPSPERVAAQGSGRPRSVTAAGWITIGATVVSGTYLAVLLASLLNGGTSGEGPGGTFTTALVVALGWCVLAGVLAVKTMRGSSLAWIGLAVSAVLAGSISLTASAYLAAAFLILVACVAAIVLLLTGSARAWFREGP